MFSRKARLLYCSRFSKERETSAHIRAFSQRVCLASRGAVDTLSGALCAALSTAYLPCASWICITPRAPCALRKSSIQSSDSSHRIGYHTLPELSPSRDILCTRSDPSCSPAFSWRVFANLSGPPFPRNILCWTLDPVGPVLPSGFPRRLNGSVLLPPH